MNDSASYVMQDRPGSSRRPLRIAIVGAGPSGFYTAGALFQQKDFAVSVDMFDRLPAPFGLVRYGVAPDHQKIKSVTKIYNKTASDPRFRFFGNVQLGEDITHAELKEHYDQVVYAVGAQSDRQLGIPGEDLRNSLSATQFVAWYNGHNDHVDLDIDLGCESAVVVGVGNVAVDVARILGKSNEELAKTDMADYAIERLRDSRIKDIYILARRGPAQAKFTHPELRELGELDVAELVIRPEDLELDAESQQEAEKNPSIQRILGSMTEIAQRGAQNKDRRIHIRFLVSPVEIIAGEQGEAVGVRVEKNELRMEDNGYLNAYGTGEYETIPACLVLRSVGYRGVPLADVPFDERRGIIPNVDGRVVDPETREIVPGEYVVGWAKRGPSGVIGTNKPDAIATVKSMLADVASTVPAPSSDPDAIIDLLQERGIRYVSIDDWRMLDRVEVANGAIQGRPRIKLTRTDDMLVALNAITNWS